MVKQPTKDDEARFKEQLRQMVDRAKKEANYNATRFREMLSELGGFGTAHRLLARKEPSDGFTNMHLAGRIDLTMECLIQKPEWRDYFSEHELQHAKELTGDKKC